MTRIRKGIPLDYIEARTSYYAGELGSSKRLSKDIERWLMLEEKGASPAIMNGLLREVLRAFREKDAKYFRRVADALEFSEPEHDLRRYIFAAFDNLYMKPAADILTRLSQPAPMLPELSADRIIEEAERLWEKAGHQPINGTRWDRQLRRCGLGSLVIEPRKGGRKKGTRNAL